MEACGFARSKTASAATHASRSAGLSGADDERFWFCFPLSFVSNETFARFGRNAGHSRNAARSVSSSGVRAGDVVRGVRLNETLFVLSLVFADAQRDAQSGFRGDAVGV
jgi:hypothetical protein